MQGSEVGGVPGHHRSRKVDVQVDNTGGGIPNIAEGPARVAATAAWHLI